MPPSVMSSSASANGGSDIVTQRSMASAMSDAIDRTAHGDHAGPLRSAARFYILARPFWCSREHVDGFRYESRGSRLSALVHSSPRLLAASWSMLMAALLIATVTLQVKMSFCHRHMSTALGKSDAAAFYSTLQYFLLLVVCAAPLMAISQYARSQLTMHWRIFMTNDMLHRYLSHRNYYHLQQSSDRSSPSSSTPTPAPGLRDPSSSAGASPTTNGIAPSSPPVLPKKSARARTLVDNPDHTLSDDVRAFTRSSLTFLNELVDELFQLAAFSGILYAISPMLVCGLIVYAAVGTYLATGFFGVRLIASNGEQSRLEADFRFGLVRLRTNAESVAFYSGERAEMRGIAVSFKKIVDNLCRMAGVQRDLALFKHAYGFLTMLIPPLILAPLYFDGLLELGVISQASLAFRQIFNSLNIVVSKMNELAKWRAGLERIWALRVQLEQRDRDTEDRRRKRRASIGDACDAAHRDVYDDDHAPPHEEVTWSNAEPSADSVSSSSSTIQTRPSRHLRMQHVTVRVSDSASSYHGDSVRPTRILVQNLSFCLPNLDASPLASSSVASTAGVSRGLLIAGSSGQGKTTLLRTIAGLWPHGSGTIHRPHLSELLFLPQRPYMPRGTLREALLYPLCARNPVAGARTRAASSRGFSLDSAATEHPAIGLRRRRRSDSSDTQSVSESASTDTESSHTDEELARILHIVNLAHLLPDNSSPRTGGESASSADRVGVSSFSSGLDFECDWSEVLSIGECQRISFARVLIHQPLYAFCDEITAALDATNEDALYTALATHAPHTVLVSVGHRSALIRHHSHMLRIGRDGRWEITTIGPETQRDGSWSRISDERDTDSEDDAPDAAADS